jgi:hypothetical protein
VTVRRRVLVLVGVAFFGAAIPARAAINQNTTISLSELNTPEDITLWNAS